MTQTIVSKKLIGGVQQYALLLVLAGVIVVLLTACNNATATPERAAAPTLAAPEWREAAMPITRDRVNDVAYLGRLDQGDTAATVFAHAVSPDGLNLLGLTSETVIGWDLLTGERIFTNARLDTVSAVFSSDKTEVFGVDSTGDLRVMNATTGRDSYRARGHTAFSNAAAFAPDFDLIALGGSDGTIKVWDMVRRESRITFGGGAAITTLAFSADSTLLAAADGDGWLRVYDWATGTAILERQSAILGTTRLLVSQIGFSPDGAQIAVALDQTVEIIPLDGSDTSTLTLGGRSPLVKFTQNGEVLAIGAAGTGLSVWTPGSEQRLNLLPDTAGMRLDADFSPDGSMLLTTALNQPVNLWNLAAMSESGAGMFRLPQASRTILNVEWTDDGRLLLLFDANGAIYAWGIPANSTP